MIRRLGETRPKTVEDELERITRRRTMHDELGFTMWTVVERASGEMVGRPRWGRAASTTTAWTS
ncbi:MAG: hypothetical protein ABR613_10055 [Actinomycetota bacterium]